LKRLKWYMGLWIKIMEKGARAGGRSSLGERGYSRSYSSGGAGSSVGDDKPPFASWARNHGVSSYKKYRGLNKEAQWNVVKEMHLCFRCLGNDPKGSCAQDRRCESSMVVRGTIKTSYMYACVMLL
jgi:hypothetical protein